MPVLRTTLEVGFSLAIGWGVGSSLWLLVPAPTPKMGPVIVSSGIPESDTLEVDLAVLTQLNPFTAPATARESIPTTVIAAATPTTSLDLQLMGVRAGGPAPSAIVKLGNGLQRAVGLGDDVIEGVRIIAIDAYQVVLDHDGRQESLLLSGNSNLRQQPAAPVATHAGHDPPAASDAAAKLTISPQKLFTSVRLEPRERGGAVDGFYLSVGDATRLAGTGLLDGDVLLAIDGERIAALTQLPALLRKARIAAHASVDVERDSQVMRLNLIFED
ncbi:MAG: hypothetical protein H6978_09405 [Gammaproteobacteria bacterium]|nr:hypothetical protein [Gammaproteobacteria bacterium]